jgi:putative SOS response-associated peptidase YedK
MRVAFSLHYMRVWPYAPRSDKQKIAELFAIHGPVIPDFGPSGNVAPQTFQPVVRLNRDAGEREIVLMRWGLIPYRTGRKERASASVPSMRKQNGYVHKRSRPKRTPSSEH